MQQLLSRITVPTALTLSLVLALRGSHLVRADEVWNFIVVSDSLGRNNGVNTEVLGHLAEQIAQSSADFVLFPGGLIAGSTWDSVTKINLEQWRTTMEPVYKAGIKVYPVPGNHEWADNNLPKIWRRVFPELPNNGPAGEEKMTYSFIHKNALIFGLDQNFKHPHTVDLQWLDKQLGSRDARAQPHVFAFAHEPAFATYHEDCLDYNELARDIFVQLLLNSGGRIYFCGHDIFYNHAEIRGLFADNQPTVFHQVIIATAGAPTDRWKGKYEGKNGKDKTVAKLFHDDRQGGYCQVEVKGLTVTVKYYQCLNIGEYVVADTFSYALPVRK
jgi:hypothetical protein